MPIPAIAPELRLEFESLLVVGVLELPAACGWELVVSLRVPVLCSWLENVTPAFFKAMIGADAGVNSERSDSCHATEIGLP